MSPTERISRIYTLSQLKFNQGHYNNTSITQKMFPDRKITPMKELLSDEYDINYPYLRIALYAVKHDSAVEDL